MPFLTAVTTAKWPVTLFSRQDLCGMANKSLMQRYKRLNFTIVVIYEMSNTSETVGNGREISIQGSVSNFSN